MLTRFFGSLRSRLYSRSVKNSISSPTHVPGFILADNVEDLTRKSVFNPALPDSLSSLLEQPSSSKLPSLKGEMSISEMNAVIRRYPNQEPLSIFQSLKIRQIEPIMLDSENVIDLELINDNPNFDFIECANVLKKRRRRMRGHKHKKRLKERRHKSDK